MTMEDWIKEWNAKRFNEVGECVGSISELFTENQNLREICKCESQLYRKLKVENARLREALVKARHYLSMVGCYRENIADEADYFAKVRIDEILQGNENGFEF